MEVWKDCVDYPDLFEVSNFGNFRNKRNKKVLTANRTHKGYVQIGSKIGGRDGFYKTFKVHREVAKAFIENPKNLPYVNHKDGVKNNNHVSNLEWVTPSENSKHAFKLGLIKLPTQIRKLDEKQIEYVKKNYIPNSRTLGARSLGKKFNVDKQTILRTVHGQSYGRKLQVMDNNNDK